MPALLRPSLLCYSVVICFIYSYLLSTLSVADILRRSGPNERMTVNNKLQRTLREVVVACFNV
jgi:hypothetical protein